MTASICFNRISIAFLGAVTAPAPSNLTKRHQPNDRSLYVIYPLDRLL
ncbi:MULTISPECIES: hypothetical protein [unclassified Microcoleus]